MSKTSIHAVRWSQAVSGGARMVERVIEKVQRRRGGDERGEEQTGIVAQVYSPSTQEDEVEKS